jgi:hypothetical protein
MDDILILGMEVFSKISFKYLGKFGFGQVFVFGIHHAAKFIPVKTISFTHCFSNCCISCITSFTSLFL